MARAHRRGEPGATKTPEPSPSISTIPPVALPINRPARHHGFQADVGKVLPEMLQYKILLTLFSRLT
jgi:hypothetical protein